MANPPVAPPVSYGVEEDVFIPCGRRKGWWPVDAMATQVGVAILKQGGNAVDAVRMRWLSRIRKAGESGRRGIYAAAH